MIGWDGMANHCTECNMLLPYHALMRLEVCPSCGAKGAQELAINRLESDGQSVRLVDP